MKRTAMLQNIAKYNHEETQELRGLFEKQLMELYWSETAIAKMLKELTLNSTSKDLKSTLKKQAKESLSHLVRLVKIFRAIGIDPTGIVYEAIECFIKEAQETCTHIKKGVVRDTGIIGLVQKVNHQEIASYGTMRAYALALREEDVVTLLEKTLIEEKQADLALSDIAEAHINIEAADKEI